MIVELQYTIENFSFNLFKMFKIPIGQKCEVGQAVKKQKRGHVVVRQIGHERGVGQAVKKQKKKGSDFQLID